MEQRLTMPVAFLTAAAVALPVSVGAIGFQRIISPIPLWPWSHDGGFWPPADGRTIILHNWVAVSESSTPISPKLNGWGTIVDRLEELGALMDGWVGDRSLAPSADALKWLRANAGILVNSEHPVSVIPIEDGSLALRWSIGDDDYTAELRTNGRTYFFIDHTTSDDFEEQYGYWSPESLASFLISGSLA